MRNQSSVVLPGWILRKTSATTGSSTRTRRHPHEPSPTVPVGIRAEGRHGARTGEKDEPQPFVVDLIRGRGRRRSIDATADYRGVTDAVETIVEQGSFDLIETMAEAIAHRVASFPHVAGRRPSCTSRTRPGDSGSTASPPARPRPPPQRVAPVGSVASSGSDRTSGTGCHPPGGRRRAPASPGSGDAFHPCLGDGPGGRPGAARLPERRGPGGARPLGPRPARGRHRVEARLGRVRDERWGARRSTSTSSCSTTRRSTSRISWCRTRGCQRAFVLLPLLELDPTRCCPTGPG